MTPAELVEAAEAAIRSNFAMRNSRAFANGARQRRIAGERRRQIREWIATLRIARSADKDRLARALKGGPLMAHDVRRRVMAMVHSP